MQFSALICHEREGFPIPQFQSCNEAIHHSGMTNDLHKSRTLTPPFQYLDVCIDYRTVSNALRPEIDIFAQTAIIEDV